MKFIKYCSFIIIGTFCCFPAFGQDAKAIEKDLVNCFKKIAVYNDSITMVYSMRNDLGATSKQDSETYLHIHHLIMPVDTALTHKVLYYTSKFPVTLTMDFQLLHTQDVDIITSDDSLFRIYVWEEHPYFTSRHYSSVFQYKTGSKVKSTLLPHSDTALTGSSQAFFDAIYTVNVNNKTYYLCTYINKYTPTIREEGIKVFAIDSAKVKGVMKYWLNDTVHLFKTKTGKHNELSYKYDVIASGDAGTDNGIEYDTAANIVAIPVVEEKGRMTDKHIKYKFKTQYFEKVEEVKPKPVKPIAKKKKKTTK
ncbi:MAG TPA: hypothetical protein VNY36_04350 [Bacteroidia bacterium]|nr:hypothetical protein [Bacteroidia bacterium]